MIEILIEGMTNNRGGKESYITNIYNKLDKEQFNCSFIAYDEEIACETELRNNGADIIHLPARSTGLMNHRRALNQLFRQRHFDVLWAHKTTLSACEILEIAKHRKVPLRIVHSHSSSNMGNSFTGLMHAINKHFVRKWANEYFACSETAAKWFYGDKPSRLMKNGIDTKKFRFNPETREKIRHELGLEDFTVIGHVGRFGVEKNHRKLINVFNEAHKLNPKTKLVLCGDGKERDNIESQIHALDLEDSVILLGVISNVDEMLQAMDMIVMPSLFEGLPYALLEAQAAGLKCIVSDTVSRESDVLGWNSFLPLSANDKIWAKEIIETDVTVWKRYDAADAIKKNGFDIYDCVHQVERIIKQYEYTIKSTP